MELELMGEGKLLAIELGILVLFFQKEYQTTR